MIVSDTSALISLAAANVFEIVVDEFEIHTTDHVVEELRNTAEFTDRHADAASVVLSNLERIQVHVVEDASLTSSRIDAGEASCIILARRRGADFLLTDDLRALPELQQLTDATVAISPILLRALVKRGRLTNEDALEALHRLATDRDWLGAPIFRRAEALFEE